MSEEGSKENSPINGGVEQEVSEEILWLLVGVGEGIGNLVRSVYQSHWSKDSRKYMVSVVDEMEEYVERLSELQAFSEEMRNSYIAQLERLGECIDMANIKYAESLLEDIKDRTYFGEVLRQVSLRLQQKYS